MSEKYLAIWGSIASILGLGFTLITLIFTEYKIASLISLLIFESIIIFVWILFQKQRHKTVFPYEWEQIYGHYQYTSYSENSMKYEVLRIIKITCPYLSSIPITLFWSGKGDIKVYSRQVKDDFDIKVDGVSGEINFEYPLKTLKRFGETAILHFVIELNDHTGMNLPHLSVNIRVPTELVILEVILKHKKSNPPALLGYQLIDKAALTTTIDLYKIEFDSFTRSYKTEIQNPILGRSYRLTWEN